MIESIKTKLEALTNTSVLFENKVYDITKVNYNASKFTVFSKQRTFVFLPSEAETFLQNIETPNSKVPPTFNYLETFKGTETLPEKASEKINLSFFEPTESQKSLQKALLDVLEKVKDNPKHIPQAKAVCEIANTMVNMEKSQIQLMNLVRKSSKN